MIGSVPIVARAHDDAVNPLRSGADGHRLKPGKLGLGIAGRGLWGASGSYPQGIETTRVALRRSRRFRLWKIGFGSTKRPLRLAQFPMPYRAGVLESGVIG